MNIVEEAHAKLATFREEIARLKTRKGTQQDGHQHTCPICRTEWKHSGEMKPDYVCEMRMIDDALCWDCFVKVHEETEGEDSHEQRLYQLWWSWA